jgi:hypothetical protein
LIAKLIWNLEASIVDEETEFLHGELHEEIYMNISEGISFDSKYCFLLTKTIYGLVQSAREFYRKLMATLRFLERDIKNDSRWSHNDWNLCSQSPVDWKA